MSDSSGEAAATRPPRRSCLWLGLAAFAALCSCLILESRPPWELGDYLPAAQVLGAGDELWVVVEVEQLISLRSPFASAPVRPRGKRLTVVRILGDEVVGRNTVELPLLPHVTVRPHMARLARLGDEVLLHLDDGRLRALPSLEPHPEATALLAVHGISGSYAEVHAALDDASKRSGAAVLWAEQDFLPRTRDPRGDRSAFTWRGREYRWKVRPAAGGGRHVVLEGPEGEHPIETLAPPPE